MSWMRWLCLWWLALGMLQPAHAHQSGNSYLRIDSDAQSLRVQLDFAVRDLNSLLQIPPAEQKDITREQIAVLRDRLAAVIANSLTLESDGQPVALAFAAQEIALHNDGLYVRQLHTAAPLQAGAAQLLVRYGFFNDEEKIARAFVKLSANGIETSAVFDARHAVQRLPLREIALPEILWSYAREGALHIWSGLDHLLFLLCLLLPGMRLASARALLTYSLKVITAFTVAHSITLAAAAGDWVQLPERLVEAAIAGSIVVSALLNLWRGEGQYQWKLAFGFGLIHGLGFATGLRELGLSSTHFIETLLAFNLGVEFGQLVAVVLVVPPLVWLVRGEAGRQRVMTWGSMAVLVVSAGWLAERAVL